MPAPVLSKLLLQRFWWFSWGGTCDGLEICYGSGDKFCDDIRNKSAEGMVLSMAPVRVPGTYRMW